MRKRTGVYIILSKKIYFARGSSSAPGMIIKTADIKLRYILSIHLRDFFSDYSLASLHCLLRESGYATADARVGPPTPEGGERNTRAAFPGGSLSSTIGPMSRCPVRSVN